MLSLDEETCAAGESAIRLPHLEDDYSEVGRAAPLTCCRLFLHDPICYQASSHAIEVINDSVDIADLGELENVSQTLNAH